jgi:hypothetical protein
VARNRSDARKSREDSRSRRRADDAAEPASGAEDATQPPDDESPADRLKRLTAATLAGAAVGVAVGAAKAAVNRSRHDDGDEAESESQADAGDDAPAAEASDGEAADTAAEDDSDAEPEAAAAADDDADPDDSAEADSGTSEGPTNDREDAEDEESADEDEPSADTGRHNGSVVAAVRSAREQFVELTGREPESVAAVDRSDDGWTVTFEIVELQRVPSSTDVLGSYDVVLDDRLELVGYTRGRRYLRSQSDGGAG